MHTSHLQYTAYAFSGPRKLDLKQEERVYEFLDEFPRSERKKPILVGDAPGLDALIRLHLDCEIFRVQGSDRAAFAKRTLRMLEALSWHEKPCLYAFPNKPCPVGCYPQKIPSGKGSGTWLAIAAACHLEIQVKIVKLADFDLPDWLNYSQLSLF